MYVFIPPEARGKPKHKPSSSVPNTPVCTYVRMYKICVYVYIYVCMYACMYVCMYVCLYVCMYVCVCVFIPPEARGKPNCKPSSSVPNTPVCMYAYIHTYIHIQDRHRFRNTGNSTDFGASSRGRSKTAEHGHRHLGSPDEEEMQENQVDMEDSALRRERSASPTR